MDESLALERTETIKQHLTTDDAPPAEALDAQADAFVDRLLSVSAEETDKHREALRASVETMAYDVQRKAAEQNALLQQPIKAMQSRAEDGGQVASSLIELKLKVEELDPARFDFEAGWLARTFGFLPGVGKPMKRYFSRFESGQTVIDAIIRSLESGRDALKRDNITLTEDQKRMRAMTRKLRDAIELGKKIDQKLEYRLERDIPPDDPRQAFIKEELLFALRQRLMDLEQQLAVNQQGVLAMEIIMRNNKELVRGVNRALNVTVNALQVAVTVAMALANQKVVLDKVQAVSQTTDNLIAGTAARLRQQGAEIHKQATQASINMDTLKKAFADINAAMDDISTFRTQALPQMAETVLEMDRLTQDAERAISKMEQGNRSAPLVEINLGETGETDAPPPA